MADLWSEADVEEIMAAADEEAEGVRYGGRLSGEVLNLKLHCGCDNGLRVGHWLVCPQHDNQEFVAHVRRALAGQWIMDFTPMKRGAARKPGA